jgi:hypothetical protein
VKVNKFYSVLQDCWDWRAAGNFMFGGTGSALMLMIAINSFPDTPPLPLGLTALVFIGLGLFLVWLEIGRPWRFIHTYFHPQTSWMTREASAAILLFPIAFVGIVFKIPVMITLSGLLGLLFLYCQARILLASKGIPAWREPTWTGRGHCLVVTVLINPRFYTRMDLVLIAHLISSSHTILDEVPSTTDFKQGTATNTIGFIQHSHSNIVGRKYFAFYSHMYCFNDT